MSNIYPNQRVGVFIDVQNVYHSAKNLYRARVNFKELMRAIVGRRQLIRSVAYVIKTESTPGEESFFEALRKTGFDLRVKDLQIYPDGTKKGDWDVGVAVDAMRMAQNLDVIVLVTGDGDFVPLVEYLKLGMGKEVEVVAFSRTASAKLREATDNFVEIENIPRALLRIRSDRERE